MNNYWKYIPFMVLFLAGCASGKLAMKVDPSLETNAQVYQVTTPDSWARMNLEMSFGPYQVSDANVGWTTTTTTSESEIYWLNIVLGMEHPDHTRSHSSKSHHYKFKMGNEIAWNSECALLTEEREVKEKNISSIEPISLQYSCRYSRANEKPWFLTIKRSGHSRLEVKMTNNDKLYQAYASDGVYNTTDGDSYTALTPIDTGYNWKQGTKHVAAVSIREETPRVWLDKRNTDSTNQILSMASAGLLIFHWQTDQTISVQ